MATEVKREQPVRILREAMGKNKLHGSTVLHALYNIAERMQEIGYPQMAQHIRAEMGKVLGRTLPSDGGPP